MAEDVGIRKDPPLGGLISSNGLNEEENASGFEGDQGISDSSDCSDSESSDSSTYHSESDPEADELFAQKVLQILMNIKSLSTEPTRPIILVSSGKSSKARCSVAPPSSGGGSSSSGDKVSRNHSGGNSVCPRETPKWQKPITNFFICKEPGADGSLSDNDDGAAGSSKSKPKTKRNIIQSDDEEDQTAQNGEPEQKPSENGEDDQKPSQNGEDDQNPSQNGGDGRKSTVNGENEQKTANEEGEQTKCTDSPTSRPKNQELDETIELEPLNGEDSHKIDEYYSKNAKGKGKGKKTKGKENVDVNVERRNSVKRDLEEITLGEESPHASKKVKVN